MNDLAVSDGTHDVPMMMNAPALAALQSFSELMAKSVVTIPKHLQGKPADCMAIAMQAAQWRMNPFAVAQKTHITQGGALGYEAQLVNAVIVNSGALEGRPEYEFLGDWSKILGQVEERQGQSGGKYYVATWKKDAEAGLGVEVIATLRGEHEPRRVRVMLSQAYPRFSTQWATDPQQQITYLALRKFARRYVPDAILGVYTREELEEAEGGMRDMGMVDEVTPPPAGPRRKSETVAADVATEKPNPETGEVPPPAGPAPAAEKKGSSGGSGISGGQVNYLRSKIKAAGLAEQVFLDRYQVSGLELLSVEQFDEIKSELLQVA